MKNMDIVEVLRVACLWLLLTLIGQCIALLVHPWVILPAAVVLCGILVVSRK